MVKMVRLTVKNVSVAVVKPLHSITVDNVEYIVASAEVANDIAQSVCVATQTGASVDAIIYRATKRGLIIGIAK
jgi:hypothetical protein